ncbi:MAG: hypothetical protein L6Q35_06865, partial [Phycisphaerales bacterium]|nr:hypothetical protein [Phycisphaerales bacterium]
VLANQSITDLGANWNGVDDGQTKTLTGQGMNLVRLTYEIETVPGPATCVLTAIAGLAAARRRR